MFSAESAICPWYKRPIIWLVFIALILRLVSVAINYPQMRWQNDARMSIPAVRLLEGKGLSLQDGVGQTAYRPPLYVLWLAGGYALFGKYALVGPSLIQAIVSTLNVLLVYLLARQLWRREDIALASAALLTIHPYSIWHDAALYHTFLSTALLLSGLTLLLKGRELQKKVYFFASGVCFGLCILVTSVILPFLGLLGVSALVTARRAVTSRLIQIGAFALGLFLIWSPWIIRNTVTFGTFLPLTTDSGITAWQGNNPMAADLLFKRQQESAPPPEGVRLNIPSQYGFCNDHPGFCQGGTDEVTESKVLTAKAVEWIKQNPTDFYGITAWRMMSIWTPFLTPAKAVTNSAILNTLITYGYAVWNSLLYLFIAVGIWLAWKGGRRAETLMLTTLAITGTGAYALFLYFTKYRIPFEATLLPLAGAGALFLFFKIADKFPSTDGTLTLGRGALSSEPQLKTKSGPKRV